MVSSWDGSGTGTAIRPHDAIVGPDLTSVVYAQSGSIAHHPDFMGDYFGGGPAATGRELAIGAKFYNALIGNVGPGYVVIYRR